MLESLDPRRVFAGSNDPLGQPTVQLYPNTFGVIQNGGIDFTGDVNIASGQTTAEALTEQEVARKLIAASELSQYTDAELAQSRTWAVGVKPGTNIANLERQLGSSLIPSRVVNNLYIYVSPLMRSGMSDALLAANAKNTGAMLKNNASVGGFMPLFSNAGEVATDALTPNPPTDPLYAAGLQWHLTNNGRFGGPGTSINAVGAWGQVSGRGVTVTVVDSGVFWNHEDLSARYRSNMSFDFQDDDGDPSPTAADQNHGTSVAGLIVASGNNNRGGLGVAPDANMAGIKLDFENGWDDLEEAQLMEYGGTELQVSNNSWGLTAAGADISGIITAALYRVSTFGRGGLGAILMKSAGNNAEVGQEASTEGHVANRYTITVGGVGHDGKRASYSEQGAGVDVTAPTQGGNFATDVGMTTTDYLADDNFSSYTNLFNGTSAATPVASGVVALILEARPDLSWRDVRAVLEQSAAKVDSTDANWYQNAAGHDISEVYGFGMVDANAAVALAKTWTKYSAERAYTVGNLGVNSAIVQGGTSTSFVVNQNLKVDQAQLFFRIEHANPEDLRISLISPSGTVVNMVHEARIPISSASYGNLYSVGFTASTDFFRDELSLGTWRVVVSDRSGAVTGTVRELQVNIFGRDNGPTAPSTGTGPATINGVVWNDLNANGIEQAGEPRLPNVVVYIDVDNNGSISINEPSAVTNAQGIYSIRNVAPGPVIVRMATPIGYTQVFPGGDGAYHNSPLPGEVRQNVKFGVTAGFDYGDARSSHGTQTAKHSIIPGVSLGATVDAEKSAIASLEALGDDVTGGDDEDGVVFSGFTGSAAGTGISGTLVPGQVTNTQVTVNTSGKSAGLLHVWADFNADGDFLDAGEKVVSNLRLGTGTFNVNIPTPSNAKTGLTYMRFRYSYDTTLNPTQAALGGEVEDYRVQVLSANPQPVDDAFSVRKFSLNNTLSVLTNDIPSTAGALTIIGTSNFSKGGSATITPDGKQLLYSPKANYLGTETFNYTVRDPAGRTAQAKVTITVLPLSDLPLAVDDSYAVGFNSALQVLDVKANDTVGTGGAITVTNITAPSQGGVLSINAGGTSVSYRPATGFTGVETFTYTITNTNGVSSTATVTTTVVPNANADDLVEFKVQTTDLNGNPISAINVGQEFLVKTFVRDLRPLVGVGSVPAAQHGVFSAHSDLLYDSSLAYVKRDANNTRGFDVVWGPNFTNNRTGSVAVDSIIDEIGALRDPALIATPAGDVDQLLYTVKMVASAAGTLVFKTDPFDAGISDVTLQSPQSQVTFDKVRHATASITINGSAESFSRGASTAAAVVISPLREALRQEAASRVTVALTPDSQSGADAALAAWTSAPQEIEIPTYGSGSSRKAANTLFANLGE